jgi:hypothetical protein
MSLRPVASSSSSLGSGGNNPIPTNSTTDKVSEKVRTHRMTLRRHREDSALSGRPEKARKIDAESVSGVAVKASKVAADNAVAGTFSAAAPLSAAALIAVLSAPLDLRPPSIPVPTPAARSSSSSTAAAPVLSVKAAVSLPNRVWEGSVNIKGPDGRWIPVEHPTVESMMTIPNFRENRRDTISVYYDERDRVILDDCVPRSVNIPIVFCFFSGVPKNAYDDCRAYRAAEGFDYTPYGMRKIGKIWVNASNARAVANAARLAS